MRPQTRYMYGWTQRRCPPAHDQPSDERMIGPTLWRCISKGAQMETDLFSQIVAAIIPLIIGFILQIIFGAAA